MVILGSCKMPDEAGMGQVFCKAGAGRDDIVKP